MMESVLPIPVALKMMIPSRVVAWTMKAVVTVMVTAATIILVLFDDPVTTNRMTSRCSKDVSNIDDDDLTPAKNDCNYRMLKLASSVGDNTHEFYREWKRLDRQQQWLVGIGVVLSFLICWCIMSCVCNCLRRCCYGGCYYDNQRRRPQRHQYTEIDSTGRAVVYHETYHSNPISSNRPCMNALWALCCFECCCRDGTDFDCCKMCVPLAAMECCCPV